MDNNSINEPKFTPREKLVFIMGQTQAAIDILDMADDTDISDSVLDKIEEYMNELKKEDEIWSLLTKVNLNSPPEKK